MIDIDGDNVLDIVSGSNDGNIYWFSGNGDFTFSPRGVLISTKIKGQTLPDVGDMNGDGIADLLVGSNEGLLLIYYAALDCNGGLSFSSKSMSDISSLCGGLGSWLSPRAIDLNGDDVNDLAVVFLDGYIARLLFNDGKLEFNGYINYRRDEL